MSLESLINDALQLPVASIAYHVSREMSRQFSSSAVLHTTDGSFDLLQFAWGRQGILNLRSEVHAEVHKRWVDSEYGIGNDFVNVWQTIEWDGRRASVLTMQWPKGFHSEEHHWVVADSMEVAEELLARVCEWNREVRGEVLVYDGGCWSKDKELYKSIQSATFENLILAPGLKDTVKSDLEHFLTCRDTYERYNVPWKRGVLLLGPPGNGKTHTVKALANSLGVPVLYVKSFIAQYETPQACVAKCFQRARDVAPCLLVMEDLDSLLTDQTRSFFLNELDGFAANTGIVTLATTNHPDRLDPAILNRPSRFDRKYHFELPAVEERVRYLQLWAEKLEGEMQVTEPELQAIAATAEGFSFAYLKELMLSSMMDWVSKGEQGPFIDALNRQIDSLREQMITAMEQDAAPTAAVANGFPWMEQD